MTIYFVQVGENGPIKIGCATNVSRRIAALQVGSCERLILRAVMEGSKTEEYALHNRFRAHRKIGEWFEPNEELTDLISGNVVPALPVPECETVSEFIKALGGTSAAADLYEVGPSAISNWLKSGQLPDAKYRATLRIAGDKDIRFRDEWFGPTKVGVA